MKYSVDITQTPGLLSELHPEHDPSGLVEVFISMLVFLPLLWEDENYVPFPSRGLSNG
jgi:hypothetical protein